jgi:hypothetical protein
MSFLVLEDHGIDRVKSLDDIDAEAVVEEHLMEQVELLAHDLYRRM